MTQIKSALTGLYPTTIKESGVTTTEAQLNTDLKRMSNLIHDHAQSIWNNHSTTIEQEISKIGSDSIPYKRDFLRKDCGINVVIPRQKGCLVGLMREIADHKAISEAETYIKSPNPYKKIFTYNKNIDLSVANNNLAKISYNENQRELILEIRVMEKKYSLLFILPKYVTKRNVEKVSKPRVRLTRRGVFTFDFTLFEAVKLRSGGFKVGIDLGKVERYCAVVTTPKNKPIASYIPSKKTKRIWQLYENLSVNIKGLKKKIEAYKCLGLDSSVIEEDLVFCQAKRSRVHQEASKQQAAELAKKLDKFEVSTVAVEELGWTKKQKRGAKQKAGSWSFSRQQSDFEHAFIKRGARLKKVSAWNSSQKCSSCGEFIEHKKKRKVWCEKCKSLLDRDFNAALNMVTLKHLKYKKLDSEFEIGAVEDTCSGSSQGIIDLDQSSSRKVPPLDSIE